MSLRETLLSKAKKPNKPVEIDGVTYYFRSPTIATQDNARKAGGVAQGKDGNAEAASISRWQASILIDLLVDEGNNLVFTLADMPVICEAELGGTIAKLMTEATKMIGEANEAGKNSTVPTEPA